MHVQQDQATLRDNTFLTIVEKKKQIAIGSLEYAGHGIAVAGMHRRTM